MLVRSFLAGYVACILTVAAVGILARAFSCEQWGGINTISHHFDPAHKYNEENWGAFYECKGDVYGIQAGYYLNSYKRDTWYGTVMYQPWEIYGFRVGGFAGAGTGYREKSVNGNDVPRGGLSPLAGGIVSLEGRRVGMNLVIATSVIGLQLKVRLD